MSIIGSADGAEVSQPDSVAARANAEVTRNSRLEMERGAVMAGIYFCGGQARIQLNYSRPGSLTFNFATETLDHKCFYRTRRAQSRLQIRYGGGLFRRPLSCRWPADKARK